MDNAEGHESVPKPIGLTHGRAAIITLDHKYLCNGESPRQDLHDSGRPEPAGFVLRFVLHHDRFLSTRCQLSVNISVFYV